MNILGKWNGRVSASSLKAGKDGERGADVMQLALYGIGSLLLTAVIFSMFNSFISGNKIKDHVSSLKMLDAGIESLYKRQHLRSYTGILAANISQSMATPSSWKNGIAITNEWNGDVTLFPAVPPTRFVIIDDAIPSAECIDIVTSITADFFEVRVSAAGAGAVGAGTVIADMTAAVAECNKNPMNALILTHK